jgi:hypothetical protein
LLNLVARQAAKRPDFDEVTDRKLLATRIADTVVVS